jgi:4,5-dihydroxyphthalate decarboxylase
MGRLTISVACCDYDRTRALFDGRVGVEGCEIIPLAFSPEQTFQRAFGHQEFDVSELSMSGYMTQQSRGVCPYVAIPAFVSRSFRHSSIYIRTDRGISVPADLKGKTVGLPEYHMTAAMWIRGILQDEYGVKPSDIRWRFGGIEQPGRKTSVAVDPPTGVEIQSLPPGGTLAGGLAEGTLDAVISAKAPSCYHTSTGIERLFPDYRATEEAYYRKTGLFPIMHLIGIRRSLLERHPWLAVNVYLAFLNAKQLCYRNLEEVGHLFTTLPWPVDELHKARKLMGDDFWRYGVKENAGEIEAMTRYSFEQGLTSRKLAAEDLFVKSTMDLPKL